MQVKEAARPRCQLALVPASKANQRTVAGLAHRLASLQHAKSTTCRACPGQVRACTRSLLLVLLLEATVLPVHRPRRLRHDSLDQGSVVARVDGVLEYVVDLPQLLF